MKNLASAVVAAILLIAEARGEKKLKFASLPATVQAAVREQTKDSVVRGISTETENGKVTFEIETTRNGKSRDLEFDKTGALLETEDEVDLDSLPYPAKAALQKRSAGGSIKKVEKLTAGASISYEANIRTKEGRTIEVGVNPDGTPHKE